MRKALLIFLAVSPLTFHLSPLRAQWWDAYSEKTGLILSLHQTDTSFELYSPLQTSDPIPVSKWSLQNDTLRLECASIGFKATLRQQDSLWEGNWRQGIMKEVVTFHPTDTLFQLRRPQTPQPPYRFDEETVAVDYVDSQGNKVHLEGTLTYPKQSNASPLPSEGNRRSTAVEECVKFPTLLLVSGSGQQNRDEEIFQHKPFLVLADYLASRDIAVLRYDDRGIGASTGPLDSADTRLFSEDAEAMFNTLKTNPHVDTARLGIGGHSEGGAIAPMVAAKNKGVKFVVMLAGQGCTGLEVLVQQNEALYRAKGVSKNLCALRAACMRELLEGAAACSQHTKTTKELQSIILRHTEGLTKEQIDSIDLKKGSAYALKQQLDTRWMQTFLTLDPAEYMPNVTCPILALNGWKDCQVLCEPNLNRIEELTQGRAACNRLRWLNHLFQHCTTGSPDEYMLIEETFDPDTMETIADWILTLP